jgi:CheY-like chemotaxis protein
VPATGTILIVDDSPDDVQLLLRTFSRIGIQNPVHVCSGGAEALRYLFDGSHDPPALVLLDLKMPGVDGFHVLSKVKSHPILRDVIIIVLTTSFNIGDIQLSYELGANSFITKPFDLDEFKELVKAFHQYWIVQNQPVPKRGRWIKKPSADNPLKSN